MSSVSSQLAVAVIGYTGGVGSCLVSAMNKIHLVPVALVRSSTMTFGGTTTTTTTTHEEEVLPTDYQLLGQRLLEHAHAINTKNGNHGCVPVIADVTASSSVQEHYKDWLRQGISVVAANKGIFAGPEATYQDLVTACQQGKSRLLHETTVGAGLPVLGTLQGLVASSHEIHTIEGILSGTLAYVLGQVAGGKTTLSQAVQQAKALGYTEPDPRDDLNGMDVARKAVILARLAGLPGIDLSQLDIESLVPEPLRTVSVDEFLSQLHHYDAALADQVATVEATGGCLHYAAKVNVQTGQVRVGLLSCEASHPFNNAGPDNMVAITTNYYTPRPLVVQGAGAGGDVTATGVLADILQCRYRET
jgi:homoserine dehydrogenase